jgi:hypothetical protein
MVSAVSTTVVIGTRFNGPPDSGNGGYSCGLLAREIEGAAEVSLRAPPPVGRELVVSREGDGLRLLDGETLVAEGTPADAARFVEPPSAVSLDDARAAAARSTYLNAETHPFPTCFVCGPLRDGGDGLRIFPGRLQGRPEMFACTWTPLGSDADGDGGGVREELVWAALDCPTSAPGMNAPGPDGTVLPIVLARLAVDVRAPVLAGAEHVITSWEIGRDGRKREAGAALYGADGSLAALARALWIELRAPA